LLNEDDLKWVENGYLTEAAEESTKMLVPKSGISDLTGIEHFKKITYLNCMANELTTLDISKNTLLTNLNCRFNNFTTLDISKNIILENFNGQNQTIVVKVKCNSGTWEGQIDLSDPQNLAEGIKYANGKLILSCNTIERTPFSVSVGVSAVNGREFKLSGIIIFEYITE
jgi:hypothetical protein